MNISLKTMNKAPTVKESKQERVSEMKVIAATQSGIEMRERQTHSLFTWSPIHSGWPNSLKGNITTNSREGWGWGELEGKTEMGILEEVRKWSQNVYQRAAWWAFHLRQISIVLFRLIISWSLSPLPKCIYWWSSCELCLKYTVYFLNSLLCLSIYGSQNRALFDY